MRLVVASLPVLLALIAGACSSFDSDTGAPVDVDGGDASAPDAPVIVPDDASSTEDAADTGPPPACDVTKPFGAPELVPGLESTAYDQTPRLTPDELTVVFESTRSGGAGGYDLYMATRGNRSDPFDTPAALTVNTTNNDVHGWIGPDGLTLLFARAAVGMTDWEIYRATRANTTDAFGTPSKLDANVNFANIVDNGPFLSSAGVLYFVTNRNGVGGALPNTHLWEAKPMGPGFAAATRVQLGAQDNESEDAPVISADGLTLFTSRIRTSASRTDYDVMVATRTAVNLAFGVATVVPELATATHHELPGWVSADGCRLYLTRGLTGNNPLRIYMAQRPL